MKPLHLVELLVLAAIWGASFIFMRVAVPEFGPIPLIGIRCLLAALVLFPVFLARKPLSLLWLNKRHILFIGTFNSALPFTLFAFATLHLSAGFTAIINATVSILTAVIAYFWLKESLTLPRALGLLAGFGGVVALVVSTGSLDESSTATAVLAGLGASFSYGVSACYIRRNLQGIDSLTLSLSSLVAASLVLLPLTIGFWPETMPSTNSWINAVVLAGLCTGLAYILYFRLIRHIGSSSTASVTLLIPLFGMMWGVVLLDEVVTFKMILAALLIIAGTAISSGIINPKAWIKHIQ